MENIKVYPAEIEAGLGKAVANNITSYSSELKIVQLPQINIAKASEIADVGLFHVPSILASVGWNKNDDVFSRADTFNARKTPINKPFNYMHQESDIIGHTVASYVVTQDGNLWLNEEAPPEVAFDIVDDSVIYTRYGEEDNKSRIERLIAEIRDGKWFVSMECVFPNFDYALIDASGNERVVARNQDTAFLTKYLKIYGGNGVFENQKIGRVLRNFVFSGKGLVDRPANERSIILTNVQDDKTGEEMEVKELESQLAEAKVNVEKANASVEVLSKDKVELTKSNEELTSQVDTLRATVEELTKEVASLKEILSTRETEVASLRTELDTSKAEILKASRTVKIVKAELEDRKDELLEKFSSVSEEVFDEFLAVYAAKKDKGDMMKEKCEEKAEETKAEEADALENIETEKEATLATAGLTDDNSELMKSVASWVQENILANKKSRK